MVVLSMIVSIVYLVFYFPAHSVVRVIHKRLSLLVANLLFAPKYGGRLSRDGIESRIVKIKYFIPLISFNSVRDSISVFAQWSCWRAYW